jgi:hypothetical protein
LILNQAKNLTYLNLSSIILFLLEEKKRLCFAQRKKEKKMLCFAQKKEEKKMLCSNDIFINYIIYYLLRTIIPSEKFYRVNSISKNLVHLIYLCDKNG